MTTANFTAPFKILLSFRGRMNRLQYVAYGVAFGAALFVGVLIVNYLRRGPLAANEPLYFFSFAVHRTAVFYMFLWLFTKRLHDLGWPAVTCLITLIDIPFDITINAIVRIVPLHGLVWTINDWLEKISGITYWLLALFLCIKRGQPEANKYGPDPLAPPEPDASVF